MATTKRVMVNLTKGMEIQLDELKKLYGEGISQVFQRALLLLHNEVCSQNKPKNVGRYG